MTTTTKNKLVKAGKETKTTLKNRWDRLTANEVERFDISTETKILQALTGIFPETMNLVSEDKIINGKNVAVVDPSHVQMVIAKTARAKILLRRFVDPTSIPTALQLDFSHHKGGNSLFGIKYFIRILKVLEKINDNFNIEVGVDTPVKIESEDFIFYLAPRLKN